jgi:hypothetical protein
MPVRSVNDGQARAHNAAQVEGRYPGAERPARERMAAVVHAAVLAAGRPSPLLFVTVPAGIIVVGVAAAFTEGLRHHIRRAMRVPDRPARAEE